VSEPRRAALLLPCARPKTQAEREAFAAQHLACQLYAGNHDMVIVGLCDVATDSAEASAPSGDAQLPGVGAGGFDLVLAVAPQPEDDAVTRARFAEALEQLREQRIDVVLVERRET